MTRPATFHRYAVTEENALLLDGDALQYVL